MPPRALRVLVSALLVVSAALFAVGVSIERHDTHNEAAEGRALAGPLLLADVDEHHSESGESAAHRARERRARGGESGVRRPRSPKSPSNPRESGRETPSERHAESRGESGGESPAHRAQERNGERVFGIDTESTPLVAVAVGISVLLALAVWIIDSWLVLVGVVGFGLVAAAFDVREVFHQLDESRTNLVVIASLVAGLHVAVAASAAALLRPTEPITAS
jgi:hypothetical protein